MNVYDELVKRCDSLVEAYRDDLLLHDKELIEMYPGRKFLHFTRNTGTFLFLMHPADDELFPSKGERVPYLFGTATREHMLEDVQKCVKGCCRSSDTLLILYYDGVKLRDVSSDKAFDLWLDYTEGVCRQWTKEALHGWVYVPA